MSKLTNISHSPSSKLAGTSCFLLGYCNVLLGAPAPESACPDERVGIRWVDTKLYQTYLR